MITSPSHAIELLGGYRAVAEGVTKPHTTVSSWASRQSIPVDAWPKLIELARERGIDGFTYEALVAAHAKAKGERASQQDAAA